MMLKWPDNSIVIAEPSNKQLVAGWNYMSAIYFTPLINTNPRIAISAQTMSVCCFCSAKRRNKTKLYNIPLINKVNGRYLMFEVLPKYYLKIVRYLYFVRRRVVINANAL